MASSEQERESAPTSTIARNTLVVVAILATALFFWQIKEALLLAFAGVLVGTIISGMGRGLRRYLPLSRPWSLGGAGILVVLVIGLFVMLFGPQIAEEFEELTQRLPEQITELQETVQDWPMGEQLLDGAGMGGNEAENTQEAEGESSTQQNGEGGGGGAGGMLFEAGATIVDVLSSLVLVLFIGIFFAISPGVYKRAILLLIPQERVERVSEALEASGNALWQWLMGQLIAMAFVGISVTIGLLIVGVPLALVLGFITGLFNFVPFVGPLVAAVPVLLLAMAEGGQTVLLAGLVLLVVQQIDGNIVTPLVQRRKVALPPAAVLLSVVAFGLVFGIPGVILATPLAVIAMVLGGMLYAQDVLGKEVSIPGTE